MKRNDAYIASELFLLAALDDRRNRRLLKQHGAQKAALEQAIQAVRGVRPCSRRKPKPARGARQIHARPHRRAREGKPTRDRGATTKSAARSNPGSRTKNNRC